MILLNDEISKAANKHCSRPYGHFDPLVGKPGTPQSLGVEATCGMTLSSRQCAVPRIDYVASDGYRFSLATKSSSNKGLSTVVAP